MDGRMEERMKVKDELTADPGGEPERPCPLGGSGAIWPKGGDLDT